ncbi:MAG: OsmC family protein [Bacteroidia bacterium]|nr:OsmC family protein [Bacteroidia bacterium]
MSNVTYLGELRTEATHERSGNKIITDAPVDNQGKGEAFSPTDLTATALASCMLTIMGIKGSDRNIDIDGATVSVQKVMNAEPRMISEIHVNFSLPEKGYSQEDLDFLKDAAINCPVAKSLNPEIKQVVNFH